MRRSFLGIFFVSCLLAMSAAIAHAEHYQPARGSAERQAQMDALRGTFTPKFHGQDLIFKVMDNNYQSNGTWAFVYVYVYRTGGKPIDFKDSDYNRAMKAGMPFDSNGIFALFKKVNGQWTLVEFADFPTDVPYVCWWKQHKVPKEIFPYTEESCDPSN